MCSRTSALLQWFDKGLPSERPGMVKGTRSILRSVDAASQAILVLGSPRSGTTWLAKILDSHPDVLYRHEPDEVSRPVAGIDPHQQLTRWIRERSARVAAKPPLFPKSWLPQPLSAVRAGVGHALKGVSRLPLVGSRVAGWGVPDLVALERHPDVRVALKLVNWNANAVLRALPGCRALFILRHPCGQIASAMTGAAQRRLATAPSGRLSGYDEAATMEYAARHGVDASGFRALSEAARQAWNWRAFNEPTLAELGALPNVRLVRYEDLCADPDTVARSLFFFLGLSWHRQTADFIARSTHYQGVADYFSVFRSTSEVAGQWRRRMPADAQKAVRSVVLDSPLAGYWNDLVR